MKTTLKLLMAVLITGWYSFGHSQNNEWEKPIQPDEKEIDYIELKVYDGMISYCKNGNCFDNGTKNIKDSRHYYSERDLYNKTLSQAKLRNDDDNIIDDNLIIRNFNANCKSERVDQLNWYWDSFTYYISASVVIKKPSNNTKENPISKALDKALQDIREGSRIAIDQVKVPSGMDRNEYKDEIVEFLLDKGYKVVAKEYLEKLYEEQQAQQSGIYNDRTTVKENNFSAVGYYLNVRLTDTSLRVQVINVSTGEYDANVTIKF